MFLAKEHLINNNDNNITTHRKDSMRFHKSGRDHVNKYVPRICPFLWRRPLRCCFERETTHPWIEANLYSQLFIRSPLLDCLGIKVSGEGEENQDGCNMWFRLTRVGILNERPGMVLLIFPSPAFALYLYFSHVCIFLYTAFSASNMA